ncbi:MAG: hypothetical protein JSU77_01475 [Fidelibacterota bacterium]|nr:MAG: hypothetical protein JSU77_01475 [Candidatus Neomarinimicrobiota bacterium]
MRRHSNHPGALLLLFSLLIWLGMACAAFTKVSPVADITGTWKAEFDTPEGKLEIFMKINKSATGDFTATMDAPAFGAYDVPLVFSFENGVVHYIIPQVQATFDGKLVDPSTIEGVASSQEGAEPGPAIFKRVE